MTRKATKLLVGKAALRVLTIEGVQADPAYQRGVTEGHKRIVAEFDETALGVPLVAEREDGSLWVVDGLQRLTALKKLGRKKVRAEVFRSQGPEHEARVFRLVNQNRVRLSAYQVFKAMLTAHDATAWAVKGAVEAEGFRLDSGREPTARPEAAANEVTCIATVLKVVRNHGADALRWVLGVIRDSWPDDAMRANIAVVEGLYTFYAHQNGAADRERLVTRLRTTTPTKLIYSANLGVGSRAVNVAAVVEQLYRKRLRGR